MLNDEHPAAACANFFSVHSFAVVSKCNKFMQWFSSQFLCNIFFFVQCTAHSTFLHHLVELGSWLFCVQHICWGLSLCVLVEKLVLQWAQAGFRTVCACMPLPVLAMLWAFIVLKCLGCNSSDFLSVSWILQHFAFAWWSEHIQERMAHKEHIILSISDTPCCMCSVSSVCGCLCAPGYSKAGCPPALSVAKQKVMSSCSQTSAKIPSFMHIVTCKQYLHTEQNIPALSNFSADFVQCHCHLHGISVNMQSRMSNVKSLYDDPLAHAMSPLCEYVCAAQNSSVSNLAKFMPSPGL